MSAAQTARNTVKLPLQRVACQFAHEQAQSEKRIVPITWHTGAAMTRQSFFDGTYTLRLSMDPAHVRMDRLKSGAAPLLDSHRDFKTSDVIGVVEQASIENGTGRGVVRFSNRDEVAGIWQDVRDGILRNASVGAQIHRLREDTKDDDTTKSFTAVDWTPVEVSIVAIGADPGAGFRGAADEGSNCEFECEIEYRASAQGEKTMTETTETPGAAGTTAPPKPDRAEEIRQRFAIAKKNCSSLPDSLLASLLADEKLGVLGVKECGERLMDAIYAAQPAPQSVHHLMGFRDERESLSERMSEALVCRYSGKAPSDGAREFMGAPIADMARECLRYAGQPITSRRPVEIIKAAMHTTSDFPALVTGTGQRLLLDAYAAASPAIKQVARRATVNDFRTKSAIRLGEAPALLKVGEGGEIHHGTRAEAEESYRAYTYARIFSISREALVNDDLSAFADFARAWGVAAATLEGSLLTTLLTGNPTMSDSKALFHADHGNLNTGGGSALDSSGLSAARLALRKQTGLDGSSILDIPPAYLLVPAKLETSAQQLLSTVYAATVAEVNPFTGGLKLLVDPRLDADSETSWYLFAGPGTAPVLEYSYLGGAEGPQIDSRAGWEVLGMEFRAVLDFGVGALDFRGAQKSTGV